jgi:hypothetical protein
MTARVAGWCLPLVLPVGRAGSLQRGLDVASGAPVGKMAGGGGWSKLVVLSGCTYAVGRRGDGGTEAFVLSREARVGE